MLKSCFIDMPFGIKKDPRTGLDIHFDQIYNEGIKPAVTEAGLECIRGDEERTGGIIHKAMFARLLLSDFVIADMTTASPNVFYELGIRHAARPYTTIPIFATIGEIPFDVALIRAIPYHLKNGYLDKSLIESFKQVIIERIRVTLEGPVQEDSPLFQLFNGFTGIEISHELTDVFRDRVKYSQIWKEKLLEARSDKSNEVAFKSLKNVETELGDLKTVEGAILVDLMLSYRDISAWDEMVALFDKMSADVQAAVVVRQQYALGLNRSGNSKKAIKICETILEEHGGSAETYGILGRVYKDLYKNTKDELQAKGYLKKAVMTYTKGFEIEPVDYYPGINAILLSFDLGTKEAKCEIDRLIPLVSFAVARRGGMGSSDYWDLATSLTLALLSYEDFAVDEILPRLFAVAEYSWMVKTTADDFDRILNLWRGEKEVTKLEYVYDLLRKKQSSLENGES